MPKRWLIAKSIGIAEPPEKGDPVTLRIAITALKKPTLWWLYATWFLVIFEFFILLHFLPTLLLEIHDIKFEDAIFITTGWLWTGLFVSQIGGWLSDRIKSRKYFVIIAVIPAHLIVISLAYLPVEMIFPALCVMGVFWFGTTGAFYAWSTEVANKENAGLLATILAFCALFGDIGGAMGTGLSGYLADQFGLLSMFWIAGGAGIAMTLAMMFLPETFMAKSTRKSLFAEDPCNA
jgi:MFS family permease